MVSKFHRSVDCTVNLIEIDLLKLQWPIYCVERGKSSESEKIREIKLDTRRLHCYYIKVSLIICVLKFLGRLSQVFTLGK